MNKTAIGLEIVDDEADLDKEDIVTPTFYK
jgi:hypothetical protein